MSLYASALARPAAIGAHAWTRIARVQPPHAGHTALAGAENASVGTRIQDRGRGPGRCHGPGQGRGRGSEIITGGSQGRARGRNLLSGDARGLTRGRGPVPILVRGPARGRGRGRAIGEVDTESAHADPTPKVRPRAAAAAAAIAGNANGGEREGERRTYVFFFPFNHCSGCLIRWASAEREERKEEKRDGVGCCFGRPVGQIRHH